jgi:hypothetical protein
LSNLGLSSRHARYWRTLPDDEALFSPLAEAPVDAQRSDARRAMLPRFPLAGMPAADDSLEICVPLGDSPFAVFLPPYDTGRAAAERDGLASFDPPVFLDARLTDAGVAALAARAEFIRYQSAERPQPLAGIHSAFFIDEISIAAIPDAIQRPWTMGGFSGPELSSPPTAPPPPPVPCATAGPFHQRQRCTVAAPVVQATVSADRIHLHWATDSAAAPGQTLYTVYETAAITRAFSGWTPVATVHGSDADLYGRPPGEYAYYVTAARDGVTSDPSAVVTAFVNAQQRPVVDANAASEAALLQLHRALMRMCAARGDCVAVLGLPAEYREDAAIRYAQLLAASHGDEAALSFAALYHPWLFVADEAAAAARPAPPDGTLCGLLARRALQRGAWVAPAAEPLTAVVALAPPLATDRLLDLQRARVNVIRQRPRGFMALDESTLSRDLDLRRVNVRRLMILLRRRAIQVGWRYVFEPNDDAFRRLMQRSFEMTLADLYARGAFAGRTAADAFQVVTDAPLNGAAAADAGRFFLELKVAPSRPLTFLRVRLVQRGERLQASEER